MGQLEIGRKIISGGGNGELIIWETATQQAVSSFSNQEGSCINDCLVVAESNLLVAGCESGQIFAYDLLSNRSPLFVHSESPAHSLTLEDHLVFSGHENGSLLTWDLRNLSKALETRRVSTASIYRTFSSDASLFVADGVKFTTVCLHLGEGVVYDVNSNTEYSGADCLPARGLGVLQLLNQRTLFTASDDGLIRSYTIE